MCDYSLMTIPQRLAIEGEELIAHWFESSALGLVPRTDYECWSDVKKVWEKVKALLLADCEPGPVVCILPGTRVRLSGLPEVLRDRFDLASVEDATFIQLPLEATVHWDALRFDNRAIVPLELLPERQRVKVLQLASAEEEHHADRYQLEPVA